MTITTRFVEMDIDDADSTFTDTLCSLATTRIHKTLSSASEDIISSDMTAADLPCSVEVSPGSVVTNTTVALPAAVVTADGPTLALVMLGANVMANFNADIESSPDLSRFGRRDPVLVRA